MGLTNALAKARRLLTDGFVVSAANVLVDDARAAARKTLAPPASVPRAVEARRDALVHALGAAVARLQQHRDAMRDATPVKPPAPVDAKRRGRPRKDAAEGPPPPPAKKGTKQL